MTAAPADFRDGPSPRPFRLQLADEVRAHLARRRISNRRFAAMLGTTPAWVDRRLNGTTPMTTDDIELFAQSLGVSLAEFMREALTQSSQPTGGPNGGGVVIPASLSVTRVRHLHAVPSEQAGHAAVEDAA